MKSSSLSRQIGILAATCLLIASLVIYVIITLLAGDREGKAVARVGDLFQALTEEAQANFTKKNNGEAIDLQKGALDHLQTPQKLMNDLYEGKFQYNDLSSEIITLAKPATEDRQALIKQAQVSLQ